MKNGILFLFFLVVFSTHSIAQGCSQCKLMAEQGAGVDDNIFASNINYGILYLMAFPYLILMVLFRKQIIRFIRSFFKPSLPSK